MPEMTAVNTSPLFYLHRLGLLKILHQLYGNITVPEAVVKERGLIAELKPVVEKLLSLDFHFKISLIAFMLLCLI